MVLPCLELQRAVVGNGGMEKHAAEHVRVDFNTQSHGKA